MSHVLHAEHFPLHGSRLIEASAGTGKTWTIAALYLRLVLGHGGEHAYERPLLPTDILVMTFTRAATRELSDRIRARLVEAVACFRGERPVAVHDTLLKTLLDDYPEGPVREQAAWRLAMAAEAMDDAAVFTIDAWCQRMLREHAFDSGNLFDETLEGDEQQRQVEAAHDYWRQQCYPLSGAALDTVLSVWPRADVLVADMARLCQEPLDVHLGEGTASALIERLQAQIDSSLAALAQGWVHEAQVFEDWLDGQLAHNKGAWDGRKLQARYYKPWFQALRDWAQQPHPQLAEALKTGAARLVPQGLEEVCKGGGAVALPPQSQALQWVLDALAALPRLSDALRLHAAAQVQQRLQWLKRQAGTFGFADMLQRLDTALQGDNGEALRARILAQYPVALIDEFQDTSPLQFRLFDALYRTATNDPHTALLLIGDPKQSIYGFRGADIYSYLQARHATEGRHYVLGTNYRSTEALVGAVNQWFQRAEEREGEGAFMFRPIAAASPDDSQNPLPFEPVRAKGRGERLEQAGQTVPAIHIVWRDDPDGESLNGNDLQKHLAQCCAEQMAQWLNDDTMGFRAEDGRWSRLRPRDMAVLVRTGREARAVRDQLQRRGIASVYLSDKESVFASPEAQDLLYWLRAVASPLDGRAVRAGLATRLMGLDLDTLAWLASNDEAFDAHSEQLRQLHGVWQRQGVLAMLRQTLHRMALPARWLADMAGERRLTNYLHLAELLQNASATLEGEQALIRWLATQVDEPGAGSDEQVVRLESDADLVKVVTVHKSKGLEYPVVMLPFAAQFRALDRRSTPFLRLPQPDGSRVLRLHYSDEELAQADRDRLREDLRLFYVALTRARHSLWLGWGPLRKGRSKTCVNEHSASGYLLGGPQERSAADWQAQVQALSDGANAAQAAQEAHADEGTVPVVQCEMAPGVVSITRVLPRGAPAALRAPGAYTARFDRRWGIGSFTSLVRAMDTSATPRPHGAPPHAGAGAAFSADAAADLPVLPVPALRPADDEPAESPEVAARMLLGVSAVSASGQGPVATGGTSLVSLSGASPAWHRFLRGPVVGNLVHDQLEWLCAEDFALPPDGQGPLADRLRRSCQRAGREAQAEDVLAWLTAVVHHRLPTLGVSLAQVERRLSEMEFWLPVAQLPAAEVDRLCREYLLPGRDRPPLPERSLHGMLMGFADLVLEHGGRYWVLDYKTNHLGTDGAAYTAQALEHAMLAHRYDVQAALYLLALHRLLQSRLGGAYDPAEQLGGALYYFLRGIDGPAGGLHTEPVPLALLAALEALIHGGPASASVATPEDIA